MQSSFTLAFHASTPAKMQNATMKNVHIMYNIAWLIKKLAALLELFGIDLMVVLINKREQRTDSIFFRVKSDFPNQLR